MIIAPVVIATAIEMFTAGSTTAVTIYMMTKKKRK